MASLLYQLSMLLLKAGMSVGALFSKKIKLGVEGRENLRQSLTNFRSSLPTNTKIVWFHAASLGEFEQGRPVMEAFRKDYPQYQIALTFFSPSGYEIRKNYAGADFVCYMPIDTASDSKWFVEILRPEIAFFIKYEFWYNFLRELRRNNIRILSFSTIFRPQQVFFKPYGGFYKALLQYFDEIFVQNEESLQLLKSIGITNGQIAGDTRFDRVSAIVKQAVQLPVIKDFKGNMPCLIAGSVWQEDMQVLIPVLNNLAGSIKVIIAPHEIKGEQIDQWMKELKMPSVRYSGIAHQDPQSVDCIIIDNIGMLSSLYRYGDMAYIGGSFGVGLHNILEAATFGMPVVFGNKSYHRFQEARDLVEKGGAFPVAGIEDTQELLQKWIANPEERKLLGNISATYVASQIGATAKIMAKVDTLIKK